MYVAAVATRAIIYLHGIWSMVAMHDDDMMMMMR